MIKNRIFIRVKEILFETCNEYLLEEGGNWRLAPAYDLTFFINNTGTGPNTLHRMSVGGKRSGIIRADLLDFAQENGILDTDAEAIIDQVAKSLSQFNSYAHKSNIPQPYRGIIQQTITSNLKSFGYQFDFDFGLNRGNLDRLDRLDNCLSSEEGEVSFTDSLGRSVEKVSVSVNSKGHYELSALIDGRRKRRFIRPNMKEYDKLRGLDIYHIPQNIIRTLIETLLPSQLSGNDRVMTR